ncbi:MAG: DUF2752 domain-containing protein [Verrucomicrobiaceae bacterium]|nr:DUF2752 domain-containing protein [Verrucomicrobiaceae bacterium]
MPPLFTPILKERAVCISILAVGGILMGAQLLGITLYVCPYRTATGIPCPGCGLTRGTISLFRGDWTAAWSYHPFSWLVLPGLAVIVISIVLTPPQRARFIGLVEKIERLTGICWLVLVGLMAFGIWRMSK